MPVEVRVPRGRVLAVVARLQRDPNIAYAEPDWAMHATALPDDPSFGLQWGDQNTGQGVPFQEAKESLGATEKGTPGADDRALKAWEYLQATSREVGSRAIVIGETDTGVEYEHPDLKENIWTNPGTVGGCSAGTHGYNVLAKNCNPMDEDTYFGGHGTHVAGILGAVGNNGVGVAGMNWKTSILPVKWMQTAGTGETSSLISALQWLVAAKQEGVNVRVVNDSATFYGTPYSEPLKFELEELGANNILFVTAAGNTGENDDQSGHQRYPCSYDLANEICVTASNNKDELPSWANYGSASVNLAAPGVSIYSTLLKEPYGYLSGGSMAAPQVAGAAALILSAKPTMSALELRADILNNVRKVPAFEGKVATGGVLDVCKALEGCEEAAPKNTALPTISGEALESKTLSAGAGSWASNPTSFSYRWLRCNTTGGSCVEIGGQALAAYELTSADVGHTIRVEVTAKNGAGEGKATSEQTATVAEAAPKNTALPTISGEALESKTLSAGAGSWASNPTSFSYRWLR
ncbi:MAG: S8 family peptidase, partial [Solirubrobacteraceae bacterium]